MLPTPATSPDPFFTDEPDMQGSKYMGAFLDFTGSGTPQIVAGYSEVSPVSPTSTNPLPNLPPKPYQVAVADTTPGSLPVFGTDLPQYTGSVFLQNAPHTPNLEFSITHFSQLYQMETGQALTSSSVVYIGGQAGSPDPDRISDMFFPERVVHHRASDPADPDPDPNPDADALPTAIPDHLRQSARASNH